MSKCLSEANKGATIQFNTIQHNTAQHNDQSQLCSILPRRRMPPRKWLRATLFGWAALAASISKEIASYVLSSTHSPSTCSPVGDNEVVGDDEVVGLAVGDNEVVGDDEVVGN